MKLDIVKKKYFCPFLFNIQLSKDTHIVNYKYDPVSLFVSENNNSKTIFRNIPLEPSELFFIHDIIFIKNLYKNDTLFWMNKIVIGQYQLLERDWLFYCGASKNTAKEMSEDRLHNFKRSFLQMFPDINKRNSKKSSNNNYNLVNRTTLRQ